jgi:dTMP kinase
VALLKFGKGRDKKEEQIPQKGKFIVIDGIDGSGKSTQLQLLKEELEVSGFTTEVIHFPQHGTRSATMVDDYLAGMYGNIGPYQASVFFATDRFDGSFKIKQWLLEGKVVLCDRYVTANAAHQGGKIGDSMERLKYFKWLDNLEYTVFGIPKPDLNIILNVPVETATKLLENRTEDPGHSDNIHETDKNHLENSSNIYQEISKLFPNTKLIECLEKGELLSPKKIHNKVWEYVRRIALKDTRPPQQNNPA